MAIRRCPYCKAIIDEGSEYCSNCGTQLLFPEDEFVEEEIPGEKIVDEDTSEEDNPKKKRSSSGKRKKKQEQQELEPEDSGEEAEPGGEEEIEEEVEFEPVEAEAEEEILEEEIPAEIQDLEKSEGDEYFVEVKEPAFRTEDLEKVIDPEEKEKEEIEKFLRSLKEDREEWNGEIPPTDELPPWAEKIKDEQPEKPPSVDTEAESEYRVLDKSQEEPAVEEEPEVEREAPVEPGELVEHEAREEEEESVAEMEILVPRGMTPEDEVPEIKIPDDEFVEEEITPEEVPIEDAFEEINSEKEETVADTSMGLPEGVEQESLPFDEKSSVDLEGQEKSPPFKLPNWIKSRAFDVLFIAALWIVTLHIASRMLSTNLFRLISQSILPSIAFYLVLLAVYLFLFFLFLGQTLGDHLFPYEE